MTQWMRIVEAGILAQRTPNVLYRLAMMGEVATRRGEAGRLEFRVSDLEQLRRKGARRRETATTDTDRRTAA